MNEKRLEYLKKLFDRILIPKRTFSLTKILEDLKRFDNDKWNGELNLKSIINEVFCLDIPKGSEDYHISSNQEFKSENRMDICDEFVENNEKNENNEISLDPKENNENYEEKIQEIGEFLINCGPDIKYLLTKLKYLLEPDLTEISQFPTEK